MLAPAVLLADYGGTLQVADLSEVRARTTQQSGGVPESTTTTAASPEGMAGVPVATQATTFGVDFYTQPMLHAHLTDRVWEYDLDYRPSLTLPDLESGTFCTQPPPNGAVCTQPEVLHIGGAGVAWHDRRVRITVTEDASYGLFNSSGLLQPMATATPAGGAPPVTPPSQLAPSPATITYFSTSTAAAVAARLDRRTSLTVRSEYDARGGLDDASRAILPELYGPRLDAKLAYALSPRDEAVTAAYAQGFAFSPEPCYDPTTGLPTGTNCTPRDQVAQVGETYRHMLDRTTTLSLGAGAAAARVSADAGGPYQVTPYPTGDAGIAHRFGQGEGGVSAVSAEVAIGPVVDIRTGLASERLQGDLRFVDAVSRSIVVALSAGGMQTIPPNAALAASYVGGSVGVVYRVDRSLEFALGERGAWQEQFPFGTFFSTYSYFDVTVRMSELRF